METKIEITVPFLAYSCKPNVTHITTKMVAQLIQADIQWSQGQNFESGRNLKPLVEVKSDPVTPRSCYASRPFPPFPKKNT